MVDEAAAFDLTLMQQAYWIGRSETRRSTRAPMSTSNSTAGISSQSGSNRRCIRCSAATGCSAREFLEDLRQQILPESPWSGLTVHDLRNVEAREAVYLAKIREEESNRRLEVECGLGFDVQLSLLPEGRTLLHVNIDMLVADASSFRILLRDLALSVRAARRGSDGLDSSYPVYRALRERGATESRERARLYWRDRIADMPDPPRLPLAVDPARLASPRITRREHRMTPDERGRLFERSRRHGLTPAMVFAAVFAEVLAHWRAEHRFRLNVPLFDREPLHDDVTDLVGDFTNSLLLALDLSEDLPFAARARAVQERFQADAAHSEYAGVEVLRNLGRARGDGPSPSPVVFTRALGMGELFGDATRRCFGNLVWMISQTPQVWLDHQVTELDGGLLLNWDAVEDLFPAGVLDAMFRAYREVLNWLIAPHSDWDQPAPVSLPAEQASVRAAVNKTEAAEGDGCSTRHSSCSRPRSLGERRSWGHGSVRTYGELAGHARQIAGMLRRRAFGRATSSR